MVNPIKAKEKAMSSEGRKLANELEEINWQLQMKEYELHKLNNEYIVKNCAYKEFIGYELTDKDKENLKKLKRS